MSEFIKMIFMDLGINSISLSVFAYNIRAKSLYEKLGFKIYEVIDIPQKKFLMRKMRN